LAISNILSILGGKRARKYCIISGLMILAAIIDTILTYAVLPIASIIINPNSAASQNYFVYISKIFDVSDVHSETSIAALSIAIAYVLRNVYMLVLTRGRYYFLGECKAYVSHKLFSSIACNSYDYFVATNTSSIQKVCIAEVARFFSAIDSLIGLFQCSVTLILISSLLVITDPVLTITAVLIMGVLTFLINRPISKAISKLSQTHTVYYAKMLQWLQQFVGCLKSVIATGKQDYFVEQFSENNKTSAQIEAKKSYLSCVTGYILNAVIMGLVFGYVAFLSSSRKDVYAKLPELALFAIAALKLMPCVSEFASQINNFKYNEPGIIALAEQMKLLNSNSFMTKKENEIQHDTEKKLPGDICLNNISFRFQDSDRELFSHISLVLPINKSVAFVGTTGSGKTTLADIILGLQTPYEGSIRVGDHDIIEEKEWWTAQIGYIPQTIYLCENSIKNNVAFGVSNELIDEQRVRECLKKAQILDFVDSLPENINSIPGENGVKLSGGQRQRIGIARALYNNPPFLVFDEATSALDTETEKAIMETINKLAGDKTILIIAHRLATIANCDHVYCVDGGKVTKQK